MPPWIHDQFGCNQKNRGDLAICHHLYIHMHAYVHIHIYIYRNLYIYILNLVLTNGVLHLNSGTGSWITTIISVDIHCSGLLRRGQTQMGGVVTVIDPSLPRVIWLGNEISCKFLQLYFGRLRFSESTCVYVAILLTWPYSGCGLSGPDAPPSLLWLPFSTKWWHLGLCHRTSALSDGTFCHIPRPGSGISTRITVKWLDGAHGPGGQISVKTFRNQKQMMLKISIK